MISFAVWLGGGTVDTSTVSLDCLLPTNGVVPRSILHQILLICLPIFVLLSISVYWIFILFFRRTNTGFLFRRVTLTALVVSYISYISLTKSAIRIFQCVDVFDETHLENHDVRSLWESDTSVECFVGSHFAMSMVVGIPLLSFSFFFPICLALCLIQARNQKRLDSSKVWETAGLFYRGFEDKFLFWDSMIMLRKALLAAIVVYAYSLGGSLQGLLASIVLLMSLFLQTKLDPFKKSLGHLNHLECASLFISCVMFLSGVLLHDPKMTNGTIDAAVVGSILVVNIGFVMVLFSFLIYVFYQLIKFGLLAEGVGNETMGLFETMRSCFSFHAQKALELTKMGSQDQSAPSTSQGGPAPTSI